MIHRAELDDAAPFVGQLQESAGPIVLINTFHAPDGAVDDVIAAWKTDATYMKSCPGLISIQLHRGIGSSRTLVNVAVWESTDALRAAFESPEFQATLDRYPEGTVACPHVFQKVAVDGVCVA